MSQCAREFLQLEGLPLTIEPQERLHQVFTGGESDPDLRDDVEHPAAEKIILLAWKLVWVNTEPGPLPELPRVREDRVSPEVQSLETRAAFFRESGAR